MKKVIVFAPTGVPEIFSKCPDMNFFQENIEDLTDRDYISIPHGEIGKELVMEMVKFFYPKGNAKGNKLPYMNVHSGTINQLEIMRDFIYDWMRLGEQSHMTFHQLHYVDFEFNMDKEYKSLLKLK